MILHLKILHNMEVIVKSSPKIEIELATKVVKVGGKVTVDSALSTESENPVQNKVITVALNEKVDKVSGKGLSTNDYTTSEKDKLASLENYNDSEIKSQLTELSAEIGGVNQEYGGDALTEVGYIDANGNYTNYNIYVHSPYIPIVAGSKITCTTNISASVSCVALYDKDKKWKRSLVGLGGQGTQSIVVEEGEAYMIMTSLNSLKAEYKVEVTRCGIKNDVANLMESLLEMVDDINSNKADQSELIATQESLNALEQKVDNLPQGEAYIMGDTLTFRNYADASIEGETLKL